jgi:hypothetical protein
LLIINLTADLSIFSHVFKELVGRQEVMMFIDGSPEILKIRSFEQKA